VSPAPPLLPCCLPPAPTCQRIAKQIWSDYQDYICARIKFADPALDKQRANEDEAI
jgi:hypothetical protein